jgi:hypothetical protein
MKTEYVLIMSANGRGHWYHFANKWDMFRLWQQGGACTMWEIVNGKMTRLVA